ncbi:MAG TPA: MBL fold metallo-hydrolase [Nostocaceae cyanobacterium]|nr:MBL fold metallo-hydrolase [Nostocaceae cyanobacterium]
MYFTWLDNNSWLLELGGQRILLDPWLVGLLTFNLLNNWDWLLKGSRKSDRPIPENIDLILLSQSLEDHAHPATLKQLDRNIPVVASVNAGKIVQQLGYTEVTVLNHHHSFTLNNQVEITAFPGTTLGPGVVENGYVVKELGTNATIYYEPHGYHSPQLKQIAPVDVIITPIQELALPLIGPILRGMHSSLTVAQWLQPRLMLPTAGEGDTLLEGLLTTFLQVKGSVEEFRSLLEKNNLQTKVINPIPGEKISF